MLRGQTLKKIVRHLGKGRGLPSKARDRKGSGEGGRAQRGLPSKA